MKSRTRLLIFLICYLAYTSIYVARLNLSMASPELTDAGLLDAAQIGMLGSIFSVIYSVGRLLNGSLGDKCPPWAMITTGLVLAGIANLSIGFFPPFLGILLLWGLNAWAQSMLWSSVLCVISAIYDEQTAKKRTSYMVTSVATGNIVGIVLNTWIITTFGVRFAFVVPGALTLIMGAICLLALRKIKPQEIPTKQHTSMFRLFTRKDIRLTILPAMLHGTMKDNISLWMTVYFVDRFAIDLEASAYFVLFIPIIGFVGRMIYPFFYKLCGEREHLVSILAFALCIPAAIPLCTGLDSPLVAAICLSLIYAAVSLINTSMLSIFPIHFVETGNVASVSGVMDFATYLGAGISSLAYGFLIKAFDSYVPMYLSWAIAAGISIILLLPLLRKQKTNN